jgi:sulfotransferase family protein
MTVGSTGALPTLVVIGAQKCGTSALHAYLSVHPEVSMSRPKELDFFIAERNWPRGIDWYRRHFDPERRVRGESSPNYTTHPTWKGVPERMAELVPDVRLIYLVRDPIERMASQWVHNWSLRRENRSPVEALRGGSTYLHRSRYMFQLDRFLEVFPADRILVLEQGDLRRRRTETLERVFGFLGIETSFRDPSFAAEVHATGGKRRISAPGAALDRVIRRSPLGRVVPKGAISRLEGVMLPRRIERPDIRAALPAESVELLREDAARLREFTGLPLDHWSV